ncbi:MAG: hypothetical protein K2M46_03085 [Lachnospiraceae bacterium]|nr:hypothetical protein [Lachnospiraceae bacterium]
MNANKNTFIKKIGSYLKQEVNRRTLGRWAESDYFDLLRGEYIENDKLALYPFVKVIADTYVALQEKTKGEWGIEDELKGFVYILRGKQDYDFKIQTRLPKDLNASYCNSKMFDIERIQEFREVKQTILNYIHKKELAPKEVVRLRDLFYQPQKQPDSLYTLLEQYISIIIKSLFDIQENDVEITLVRKTDFSIYAAKDDQTELTDKLLAYLDCYLGERYFYVMGTYRSGKANLSILIWDI